MSVPASDRQDGKLTVLVVALKLTKYTLQITKNQKIFKPEYNTAITNDIIHTAKEIYILAWRANNIRVRDPNDPDGDADRLKERLQLQAAAIEQCNELLPLIQIAKPIFHLSVGRVEYWGKLTINARTYLRSWRAADKKRYKL